MQKLYITLGTLKDYSCFVEGKTIKGYLGCDLDELSNYTLLFEKLRPKLAFSHKYLVPASSVIEKAGGSIKALPTKSVFVNSKNPHIRDKQHFSPDKEEKNVPPSSVDNTADNSNAHIDEAITKLNDNSIIDYTKLNTAINNFDTTDTSKPKELLTALVDHIGAVDKKNKGEGIKVLEGLNLEHNIGGSSVASYLFDAANNPTNKVYDYSNIKNHILDNSVNVNKHSSIADKTMGLYKIKKDTANVPLEKREQFVDDKLSEFVDQDFTEHVIKSNVFNKIDSAIKDFSKYNMDIVKTTQTSLGTKNDKSIELNSVLDHVLKTQGVDKVAQVFDKCKSEFDSNTQEVATQFMKGKGVIDDHRSLSWSMLSSSRNPKLMHALMERTGTEPVALSRPVNERVTALIDGWMNGNKHGMGLLLSKSIKGSTGFSKVNTEHLPHIPTHQSLYPHKNLKQNEIPVKFAEAVSKFHSVQKEMLNKHLNNEFDIFKGERDYKGENVKLYRGISLKDVKDKDTVVDLEHSVSSFTFKKEHAESFLDTESDVVLSYDKEEIGGEDFLDEQLSIKPETYKNIESMSYYGPHVTAPRTQHYEEPANRAYLLQMDAQEAIKNNLVFGMLSKNSFDYMKDNHNIPHPPSFARETEEYEFLIDL